MIILQQIVAESLPLWSAEGIADLRATVGTSHYPLSRVRPLLADALEQARKTHVAKCQGDTQAAAAADLERLRLCGLIEEERDRAADTGLALLSLAFERRRLELTELTDKILADAPVIENILDRLTTIERILAAGVHQ
jgi:hypothetical protein